MTAQIIQFIPRTGHLLRESEQSYRSAIDRVNNMTYGEIYGPPVKPDNPDQFSTDEYNEPPCA